MSPCWKRFFIISVIWLFNYFSRYFLKLVLKPSGAQFSSQTPRETPSLITVAAFSSTSFRSDRKIRRLLLVSWHDFYWGNVFVSNSQETRSHPLLSAGPSCSWRRPAVFLSLSLSQAYDWSGQKGWRIWSRSSDRLFFCSGVQSGEEAGLFLWTSEWDGALLAFSSSFFFNSPICWSWPSTRDLKALSSALTAAMSLIILSVNDSWRFLFFSFRVENCLCWPVWIFALCCVDNLKETGQQKFHRPLFILGE